MNDVLYIVIGVLAVAIILLIKSLFTKKHTVDEANNEIEQLNNRIKELAQYEGIVDAKKEADALIIKANEKSLSILNDTDVKKNEILDNAISEADKLKADTLNELQDAKNEASEIRANNKEKLNKVKEDAEKIYSDALRQSQQILSTAEEKAKEIEGDAYEIAKNATYYRDLAKAMKNVVEGYGDEYIKPSYSVLDDLSEEFGFTEAGQKLKDARELTKQLIKSRTAADCEYVENVRRETAINFVIDAFNGKVDSILTLIKKDNYGTLEQKIKDAYSIVNVLGTPFRNAHINEIFLNARLDELKWGVAVNELKLKEREEQREIKEQMREEERARREYEKAMKEAARDEEALKKAMEKAREEVQKASDDQKAKYEAKLADLETRLKDAEEKNQRAISMAQQTKLGHVYIISNVGSFGEDVFKIGMTRRLEPLDRVRELGDASVPFPFDVHAMIYSENAPQLENDLHKYFVRNRVNKVNNRKEFFRVNISDIKSEIEKLGIQTKWTLLAQSEEYKETLSIEKSMNNVENEKKWIDSQKEDNNIDDD